MANSLPVLGGATASTAINDGASTPPVATAITATPFSAFTIVDLDAGSGANANPVVPTTQSVTVTITLDTAAKGALTSGAGGVFASLGNGVYSFTGTDTAAQAAIRTMIFTPTANRVQVGLTETTTFTVNVTDTLAATASNNVTTVVTTSINDLATMANTLTAAQAINDNTTTGLSPFSGYSIADVDVNQVQTLSVTLSVATQGSFTTASLGGGFYVPATGVYTFIGTAAAAQTAIRGLVFIPTANFAAPTVVTNTGFTVSITDGVNAPTAVSTASVNSTSINNAPTLGGAVAGQAINDNVVAGLSPFSAFTIADVDAAQAATTTAITYTTANGAFAAAAAPPAGWAIAVNGTNTTITFTGNAANAQNAIRALTFTPATNQVAVGQTTTTAFSVTVNDQTTGGATPVAPNGSAIATNTTASVVSTSMNDAPTLAVAAGAVGQAIADTATVTPFNLAGALVTITDVDVNQTQTVSVTLSAAANGALSSANGGSYNATTGVFTITGTVAAVNTAINGLVFTPTQNLVPVGQTTTTGFTISVSDGVAPAVTNTTASVISTSANTATVLPAAVVAIQTINDNATVSPFTTYTIVDLDPNQVLTTTVTYTSANGTLAGGGFVAGAAGTYTFVGTAAAAQVAIRALVFTPTANQVAVGQPATATAFNVTVTDGAGTVTSTTGPVVAANVSATSVNNAPTLGTGVANQAVNDTATVSPFAAFTIADADLNQAQTVTITLDTALKGALSNFVGGGAYTAATGVYTFTGTAAAAQTAIQALVFTPTQNRVAVGLTETTTFTVSVNDGVAPAVTNATTTVVSTSINDAPTVTVGAAPVVATITDKVTATPFAGTAIAAGFTVSDLDPNQIETVTVTLDTAAKGALSNLTTGTYNATTGVYTFTGTAAAATTALQNLIFTPTQNRTAVGAAGEATTFTVKVTDSAGGTVTNNTVIVTASSVNDAPVLAAPVTTGLVDTPFVDTFANVTGTLAGTDVDPTSTLTYGITLTGGNIAVVGGPAGTVGVTNTYGTLTLTTATGAYTFVPNAAAIEPLGANASAAFTVTVTDNSGAVNNVASQILTIAITQSGATETTGNDVLIGAVGINTSAGLAGNDTYYVDVAGDIIIEAAGAGTDIVYSTASNYTLAANVESLVVWGAGVNGTGNADDNYLFGNALANTLDGKAGNDGMAGGDGNDVYVVDSTLDVVTENANQGIDAMNVAATAAGTYTLAANVEILRLIGAVGTEALNGVGNDLANSIYGNSANNAIDGKAGADAMAGGAGDDTYTVDNIGDIIIENASEGTDSVSSSVSYTLAANIENLTLTGTVAVNAMGNDLNNVLVGNSNNNIMAGGAGIDTMTGGTGNDTYYVDNALDVVVENAGEGVDIVYSTAANYTLSANVESLVVWGTGTNGTGNDSDNYIFGNTYGGGAINNVLSGGAGNDVLMGFDGADTYIGGTGQDTYNLTETVAATDTIQIAAGDSTAVVGQLDKAIGFTLGTGTINTTGVDQLDLVNTAISATTTSFNGTDAGAIQTNSVLNGIISFQGAGGVAISGSTINLNDALAYVQANINDGSTVAFVAGTDTYVFQDGGVNNNLDTVVDLIGVNATSLNNTGLAAGSVWIV